MKLMSRTASLVGAVVLIITSCGEQELIEPTRSNLNSLNTPTTTSSIGVTAPTRACLKCTYLVPPEATNIDGNQINAKPGDVICLNAAVNYGPLRFAHLRGEEGNPVIITNCGSKVIMDVAKEAPYVIKIVDSQHIRVTGGDTERGLLLSGGSLGLSMDYLTSDFEVDHVEIGYVGYAGIMAKTDPTCNDSTIRGNFTMKNVFVHDNFVHFTGGEGLYIGNSFYENGEEKPCGIRLPHDIDSVSLYNNVVQFTGRDGIQLGAAVRGANVFNNRVEYFGTNEEYAQNSGIQIGEGTGGRCFNNFIKSGSGNGITVLGLGNNVIQSNVIISAGAAGIFCDDRYTPGASFTFNDNLILNPATDGLRLYSEKIPMNYVVHNLIFNPGSFWASNGNNQGNEDAQGNQDGQGSNHSSLISNQNNPGGEWGTAYVFKWSGKVKVTETDNTFTCDINLVRPIYYAAFQMNPINSTSRDPKKISDLLHVPF